MLPRRLFRTFTQLPCPPIRDLTTKHTFPHNTIATPRHRPNLPLHRPLHTSSPSLSPYRTPNNTPWGDPTRLQTAKPLFHPPRLRNPTSYGLLILITGGSIIFYVTNLETVPVSGRRRFNCYAPGAAEHDGLLAYQQLLQAEGAHLLPDWDPRVRRVRRIAKRLIDAGQLSAGSEITGPIGNVGAAGQISARHGGGSGGPDAGWAVHVIDEPSNRNAFVLPGGKIFVYTGILPVCGTDDGLAAVLGHELAHQVAHHAEEGMSRTIPLRLLSFAFVLLDSQLGLGGLAQVLGSYVLELGIRAPASRVQEREADAIGLQLMAKACFDPRGAVDVWRRMMVLEERQGQGSTPEFMSTHPSHQHRAEELERLIPGVEGLRVEAGCGGVAGAVEGFRESVGLGSGDGIGIPVRVRQAGGVWAR